MIQLENKPIKPTKQKAKPSAPSTTPATHEQQLIAVHSAAIPFHAVDSSEVEFIRAKIAQNREYLKKCANVALYKKVERDTLYMENNILPVLLAKTNLFYNDVTKKFVKAVDAAIQHECNAVVAYLPINPNYVERPKVAMVNYFDKFDPSNSIEGDVLAQMFVMTKEQHPVSFQQVEITFEHR